MTNINNKNYQNIIEEKTIQELCDEIEKALLKDDSEQNKTRLMKEYSFRFLDETNVSIHEIEEILNKAGLHVQIIENY